MQFLLTAYDYTDEKALERRMNAREAHLQRAMDQKEDGTFLLGGALLNAEGQMCGSMILFDVPNRAYLDVLLEEEPYLTQQVWEKVTIEPFRLADI